MKLHGKVVLVTGASRGIGLEIARALLREGARVAFAARTTELLEEVVAEAMLGGGEAIAVTLDVTSAESVERGVAQVERTLGPVDLLVNNAGNGGALGLWADAPVAAFHEMFDVHVHGSERMMRCVLPSMRARGTGTIVNFASTVAWVPMPGAAAYSAAKAAIVALSETLRVELAGSAIDVRLFAPPHTKSASTWPLDLPKVFEASWVADAFVSFLRKDRAMAIPGGNAALLWVQRVSPRLAARIMNDLGWKALAKWQLPQKSLSSEA